MRKKSIEDSVDASLNSSYSSPSYQILTYEKNKQEVAELAKDEIFGMINLSSVAINSSEEKGCFYYALQCGKKCGGGYFVFINKESDIWQVDTIVPAWE